jgi:exonuclease SbcC
MWIQRVVAHAFGPFSERGCQFAPAMNVLYGPNEAGKSSWHAAIYAALCGMRRARGQPRREGREFEERHPPLGLRRLAGVRGRASRG